MSPSIVRLFRPNITLCVASLAMVNVAAFLVTYLWLEDGSSARRSLSLWPTTHAQILAEPWRLITFQFMHLGPLHLLANLFVVLQGGPVLERRFGSWRFLVFYLLSAATAAFAYECLILVLDPTLSGGYPRLSGASGGVYAILAGIMALSPRLHVSIFRISMPIWVVLCAVVVLDNHQVRGLHEGGEIIHLMALGTGWGLAQWFDKEREMPCVD